MQIIMIGFVMLGLVACSDKAAVTETRNADRASVEAVNESPEDFQENTRELVVKASSALRTADLQEETVADLIREVEQKMAYGESLQDGTGVLMEAELMSTLGALYARLAGFHSQDVNKAGTLASKGFRYLDKAVGKYPDNITARMNRGIVSLRAPEFLNRTLIAKEDLEYVKGSDAFNNLNDETKALVRSSLEEVYGRIKAKESK